MRVLLTFIVLVIGIFTAYYLTKQSMEQKQLPVIQRSEEHTSELQSRPPLVCRLLLEKKKYIPHRGRRRSRPRSTCSGPPHGATRPRPGRQTASPGSSHPTARATWSCRRASPRPTPPL